MRRPSLCVGLLAAVCGLLFSASQARAVGLAAAVQQSKKTGLPMLVLGTSDT